MTDPTSSPCPSWCVETLTHDWLEESAEPGVFFRDHTALSLDSGELVRTERARPGEHLGWEPFYISLSETERDGYTSANDVRRLAAELVLLADRLDQMQAMVAGATR